MVTIHELKVWPEFFRAIAAGRKTFEVRKDDRGFSEGDGLVLREFIPEPQTYTGNTLTTSVTYLLRGGQFPGITPGYVVLGLSACGVQRAAESGAERSTDDVHPTRTH